MLLQERFLCYFLAMSCYLLIEVLLRCLSQWHEVSFKIIKYTHKDIFSIFLWRCRGFWSSWYIPSIEFQIPGPLAKTVLSLTHTSFSLKVGTSIVPLECITDIIGAPDHTGWGGLSDNWDNWTEGFEDEWNLVFDLVFWTQDQERTQCWGDLFLAACAAEHTF